MALLDEQKIGLGLLACVTVRLDKHGKAPMEDFGLRVQTSAEVGACYAMTGDMDYLLRVHVEELQHFSRFVMDQLLEHPAVLDVKSIFALQRMKGTTALPLRPWIAA